MIPVTGTMKGLFLVLLCTRAKYMSALKQQST